ncbi:hypothetical protein MLD38_028729 [Melastoma candidum]|uniref:Uncharacterized protein n=1 Tax=Melastoma candidum TaxID=119954 RepID=A0ACB9N497_9MYRT|nr:hypothetical protein MLD38_028729 [Melastoma candidum]
MGFLDLFVVASIPILKVLILTALGLYLALDTVDIMGESTRKNVNRMAFFVFNPALVGSNLARTVTYQSILKLWLMPINILITFLIGSALGWVLVKVLRVPSHLKGLILGCCAAGNLGNLPIIILPAVCKEKSSPFGDPESCQAKAMAYSSLSMAIGAVYMWSYVFNIVRISSMKAAEEPKVVEPTTDKQKLQQEFSEPLLTSTRCNSEDETDGYVHVLMIPSSKSPTDRTVSIWTKVMQNLEIFAEKINLKSLLAPSTIGAIVGFVIGGVPLIRRLMIGQSAPFRVIEDSALLLGDAAIPIVTLIMGGNLLRGLRSCGIRKSLVIGIMAVRYILLPIFGIAVVKGLTYLGLLQDDPLYVFILLLQYALPPAMNIGTMTQLFGAGESECSVVMLWTYAFASLSLTLWSTYFMWLVS